MHVIADLHVHSKYSRATSKELSPEGLIEAARIKGIDIMGTGDFTHPEYLSELKEKLVAHPEKEGFFCLKGDEKKETPVFMLTQEISCIYSQNDAVRRNHILICVPDFKTLEIVEKKLSEIGNLAADGRPILGMSSVALAKVVFDANPDNLVIPAHIWTPWFSTFGSKSGFDTMKECYGETADLILAVETGLSSDPLMNWRIEELDQYAIVSNGDAHSQPKVGREATVYELEKVSYKNIVMALENSAQLDKKNLPKDYIAYTIEFYPEEGKYHYDGHRACDVSFSPEETKKHQDLCPKCRKPLTLGVDYRVDSLATRSIKEAEKYGKKYRPGFKKIVPLEEIIADVVGQGPRTKKVFNLYERLINGGKNEFNILLNLTKKQLIALTPPEVAEGILRVREGNIHITPGYDGVFGEIHVFTDAQKKHLTGSQTELF